MSLIENGGVEVLGFLRTVFLEGLVFCVKVIDRSHVLLLVSHLEFRPCASDVVDDIQSEVVLG